MALPRGAVGLSVIFPNHAHLLFRNKKFEVYNVFFGGNIDLGFS